MYPNRVYTNQKNKYIHEQLFVNLHYLFHVADKFSFYPLAGVSLLGAKADLGDGWEEFGVKASASETKFGANLGAGAQYWLTESFALALEIKYQLVSNYDRPVFTLGAAYKF